MKLSANWVTADIKKNIESVKSDIERHKAKGEKNLQYYNMGILKGLESALESIEKAYGQTAK